MLQGTERVYRKELARYVRSVFDVEPSSLFTFALVEHKRIDDIVLFSPDISISDIRQHCKSIRERIATTCKGFLEVREFIFDFKEWQRRVTAASSDDPHSSKNFAEPSKDRDIPIKEREELTETNFFHEFTRVVILHRTAFDFFQTNEQGRHFLKVNTSADPDPRVSYIKALLADLVVFPVFADVNCRV